MTKNNSVFGFLFSLALLIPGLAQADVTILCRVSASSKMAATYVSATHLVWAVDQEGVRRQGGRYTRLSAAQAARDFTVSQMANLVRVPLAQVRFVDLINIPSSAQGSSFLLLSYVGDRGVLGKGVVMPMGAAACQ